jgi:hypothetical protein
MRPFLCAAVAALAFACLPAAAGVLADLHVVNRSTGERLPVYVHRGKLYVAGEPGEHYAIQVNNRTGQRILAVVSVDGVNVVTGETASPDQTGYVFSPWQSYEITGWRKNAGEVAAFYFTALPNSYAARTGRSHDVGVIGLAVFREWSAPRHRPHPHPRRMESAGESGTDADAAARAQAPAETADGSSVESGASERSAPHAPLQQRERLGTGHGEREHSAVTFTDFRRASPHPGEVLAIHYDRRENLVARGIIPAAPHYAQPRPFPGSVRFVPDPVR